MAKTIVCLGFGFCANGLWHHWRGRKNAQVTAGGAGDESWGKLWGGAAIFPHHEEIHFCASHRGDKEKLLREKNITPLLWGSGDLGQAMVDAAIWLVSVPPAIDRSIAKNPTAEMAAAPTQFFYIMVML